MAALRAVRGLARALAPVCVGAAGGLALAGAGAGAAATRIWPWAALAGGALWLLQFVIGRALRQARAGGGVGPARLAPAGGAADLALPAVVSAFPDPCVAVDRRGVVLAVSPPALRLFPHLAIGRPMSFALRAPEFVEALEAVLNGGAGRTVLVTQRVPVERSFEIAAAPLNADRRRGALVVLRDLTDQLRVEQMRVDFIANASHELRTPLATVLGFIETLQGPARNDPAARERFLAIMRDQSMRMKRLIDDLLSLSRIEGRAHHAPSAPVDVADVARQITGAMRAMATDAGVEISLSAPEEPVIVPGDRDELLRVVENLVENAVKYGDSGKRVAIAVTTRGSSGAVSGDAGEAASEAVIEVRDFGPGIPAEHAPRLTERFYRVDAQASRGKGGSGLGLAIVKHIVNRHRGRLFIESAPGEGATFRVALPLARTRQAD
ncbi:ATP-binding protein [Camelimonas sp. ID_303_24]